MPLRLQVGRLLTLSLLATAACAGPLPPTLPTPAARAATGDLFTSLAARFTNVDRAPRFDAARKKLSRYALSPSGVFDDATVWTSMAPDGTRALEVDAAAAPNGQYRFTLRPAAPVPEHLGDGRHTVRLARAADGSYQWYTNVEQDVGRFRGAAATELLAAALARLEQPGPTVRGELQSTFPRTSAALGRLVSLDDVETAPAGDGTTRVELRMTVRPDRLRAAGLAAFAGYVDKYVGGTRWTMALDDGRGARWADLRSAGGKMQLRLRLRDGELQTLDGLARPLPDNVILRTDVFTRVLMFDVGAEQLAGNLTFVREPRERGWSIRWRQAPRWHIPLGMRHLVTGALDRPFAGAGMHTDIVLRDASNGETLLVRQFDVAVQESALVRWFGGIGARAMADLDARVESEEDRVFAEVFRGLHDDVEAAYTR
ncbi:MAG TPA: hypothetical protein VGD56_00435 [Gemmatirosa sp.]